MGKEWLHEKKTNKQTFQGSGFVFPNLSGIKILWTVALGFQNFPGLSLPCFLIVLDPPKQVAII